MTDEQGHIDCYHHLSPYKGVVGLTIDTCITPKIRGKGWVRLLLAFAVL